MITSNFDWNKYYKYYLFTPEDSNEPQLTERGEMYTIDKYEEALNSLEGQSYSFDGINFFKEIKDNLESLSRAALENEKKILQYSKYQDLNDSDKIKYCTDIFFFDQSTNINSLNEVLKVNELSDLMCFKIVFSSQDFLDAIRSKNIASAFYRHGFLDETTSEEQTNKKSNGKNKQKIDTEEQIDKKLKKIENKIIKYFSSVQENVDIMMGQVRVQLSGRVANKTADELIKKLRGQGVRNVSVINDFIKNYLNDGKTAGKKDVFLKDMEAAITESMISAALSQSNDIKSMIEQGFKEAYKESKNVSQKEIIDDINAAFRNIFLSGKKDFKFYKKMLKTELGKIVKKYDYTGVYEIEFQNKGNVFLQINTSAFDQIYKNEIDSIIDNNQILAESFNKSKKDMDQNDLNNLKSIYVQGLKNSFNTYCENNKGSKTKFNLLGLDNVTIDNSNDFFIKAKKFNNAAASNIYGKSLDKIKINGKINYNVLLTGLIGEILGMLNLQTADLGFTNITHTGAENEKVKGINLGESFTDIQATANDINFGVNIKHYTSQDKVITLYSPKDSDRGLGVYTNAMYRYFSYETVEMLKFIDTNYDFFEDYFSYSKDKLVKNTNRQLKNLCLVNIDKFLRIDSAALDNKGKNAFFMINNVVIPTSVIYNLIIKMLNTNEIKKYMNNLFKVSYKGDIKFETFSYKQAFRKTTTDSKVMRNLKTYRSGTRIQFKGFKIDLSSLLKGNMLNPSIYKR